MIALNAQVQAATLGDGTGLEVLSMRTCQISDEIYEIGNALSQTLADLNGALEQDVQSCFDLQGTGKEVQDAIHSCGTEMADDLHAHRDRALMTLMEVGEASDAISEKVKSVVSQKMFSSEKLEKISALARYFSDFAGAVAATELGVVFKREIGEMTAVFRDCYTMATEKTIHDNAIGLKNEIVVEGESNESVSDEDFFFDQGGEEPAVAAGGGDEEELGDNVELF